ncbi:MAG TPA: hypothetical protein VHF89_12525 [Solirubrobacteraceae bacterium]|nr:hypothetical protein [Solirubrobacteraceae bacterium]
MRKFLVVLFAVAVVPAGVAFANSDMKVTGGGQVIGSSQTAGPGDTIAFNAQQIGEFDMAVAPAKGQLQVIQRDPAGGGKPQVKFHGDVTCIRTFTFDNNTPADPSDDETFVRFGGNQQVRGKNTPTPFTVDVQDNGEGMAAMEADMIYFRTRGDTEDPCDDSDPATQLRNSTLARGNVQQH